MPQIDRHDTDILILGSGGAGLFAALHAQQSAPEGTRISIAVKGLLGKCGCTRMVQGGYNVALGPGDSVERHFMDTIQGGKWLPNQDMAWRLCEQAVVRVRELENEMVRMLIFSQDSLLGPELISRHILQASPDENGRDNSVDQVLVSDSRRPPTTSALWLRSASRSSPASTTEAPSNHGQSWRHQQPRVPSRPSRLQPPWVSWERARRPGRPRPVRWPT